MSTRTTYEDIDPKYTVNYLADRIHSLAKIGAAATDTGLGIDVTGAMRDLFETIAEQAQALGQELERNERSASKGGAA